MNNWRSEELIKEFYRGLLASDMPAKAAARHRDKLRFFLFAYLDEEWPRSIDRVDSGLIRDYLGSWFIRNVGGSKTDLVSYLETFRRFYEFLYNTGRTTAAEHEDIMSICRRPDYFVQLHEDLASPGSDAWEDFMSSSLPAKMEFALNGNYNDIIDRQLWMLASNMERPASPAVLDLALFLDYFTSKKVKLTPARRKLPRRHIHRINQRFSNPEELPEYPSMDSSRRINWFFRLARALELIDFDDEGAVGTAAKCDSYLDLGSEAQFSVMVDGTWNRMKWSDAGPADMVQVSEWAQRHRDGFAALLAGLAAERDWRLDPESETDARDALLARYIYFHEVVENVILFALRELGLLDYSTWSEYDGSILEVQSLNITRFGRQIMKLYARRAQGLEKTQSSPLSRLQESLLSY